MCRNAAHTDKKFMNAFKTLIFYGRDVNIFLMALSIFIDLF